MRHNGACILLLYYYEEDLWNSDFVWQIFLRKHISIQNSECVVMFLDPQLLKKCRQICSTMKFAEQSYFFPILRRNLYGRYPKGANNKQKYHQICLYKVHQVGLKDSGSQNSNSLAFKGSSVASRKISSNTNNGAYQAEFFIAQIILFYP
jgi:hypothetical protein